MTQKFENDFWYEPKLVAEKTQMIVLKYSCI